ncbi:helix-turn-helix transcriptional regulator [Wenxinia marina]|uniref:Deoxyhypusine synthase n=1 Tax=Wenxinia marina DSM 24838 TaxID=1123501 RepID=A0A0D0QAW3_9RHOB|nr:helix-turn-helix domain-containing protein [Wenxinia marina]KIQ69447.1 Deoxyhypusine synthase [Wenxinia marina DSM 24838]GGL58448.1 hypothetical protein GCM10011392_11100 [Wenxinia marina]
MIDFRPADLRPYKAIDAGPERLWGLNEIAAALGVSRDSVKRWANKPGVPIYKPAGTGRYFALRSELDEWLTQYANWG